MYIFMQKWTIAIIKASMISEKKEEIWLSPMTKAPTPTEQSKKQRGNTKTPPKPRFHNNCGST